MASSASPKSGHTPCATCQGRLCQGTDRPKHNLKIEQDANTRAERRTEIALIA